MSCHVVFQLLPGIQQDGAQEANIKHNCALPKLWSPAYPVALCSGACTPASSKMAPSGHPGPEPCRPGVRNLAPFLAGLELVQGTALGERMRVTYHDSCHLKRGMGIHQEPRRLLLDAGHELLEMEQADRCCGYGGAYSLEVPEISEALLEQKLASIEATGTLAVASDCPGCLLHIAARLRKRGSKVQALHMAQLML